MNKLNNNDADDFELNCSNINVNNLNLHPKNKDHRGAH